MGETVQLREGRVLTRLEPLPLHSTDRSLKMHERLALTERAGNVSKANGVLDCLPAKAGQSEANPLQG